MAHPESRALNELRNSFSATRRRKPPLTAEAALRGRMAMSVDEVGQVTGLDKWLIYKAVKSGALRSSKIGRRRVIQPRFVIDWLEANERGVASEDIPEVSRRKRKVPAGPA